METGAVAERDGGIRGDHYNYSMVSLRPFFFRSFFFRYEASSTVLNSTPVGYGQAKHWGRLERGKLQ